MDGSILDKIDVPEIVKNRYEMIWKWYFGVVEKEKKLNRWKNLVAKKTRKSLAMFKARIKTRNFWLQVSVNIKKKAENYI
jgi:hypothetical protein